MDNKLLKSYRLLTKNDFQNLRSESRFLVSGVLVFYIKNNSKNHARLGVAISKKLGKAVKRNRIKRKLRELFRHSQIKESNIDILVSLNFRKIKNQKLNFQEIYQLIEESFINASLLK